MARVKLNLRSKNDTELQQFAETHQTEMENNPHFIVPDPSDAVYGETLERYAAKVDEVESAFATYLAKSVEKNQAREEMTEVLTKRGNYVENASDGDPAKILSAGFEVRHENRNPIDLTAPDYLRATLGDHNGEIDLTWEPVKGAKTYIVEVRLDEPGATYQQARFTTRSSATIAGLQSTRTYVFRVKAVGAKGESEWSAETRKLVV
jgi:hypothetical protein